VAVIWEGGAISLEQISIMYQTPKIIYLLIELGLILQIKQVWWGFRDQHERDNIVFKYIVFIKIVFSL
jgi:hypothetical protein